MEKKRRKNDAIWINLPGWRNRRINSEFQEERIWMMEDELGRNIQERRAEEYQRHKDNLPGWRSRRMNSEFQEERIWMMEDELEWAYSAEKIQGTSV